MDCFGAKRSQMLAVMEKAIQSGASKLKDRKNGQKSLFGDFSEDTASAAIPLPNIPELEDKERLIAEKEVLGYYLTTHPLSEYEPTLRSLCSHTSSLLKNCKNREEVMVGGMIGSIKIAHTKNPKPGQSSKYANFDLEDLDGTVRCIQWPDGFAVTGHLIQPDAIVLLRAAVDRREGGEEVNLIVNEVIPIDQADAKFTSGIQVFVDSNRHTEDSFARLRDILKG